MDLLISKPSDKQELFLKDTHKYVGYGGSRGAGKSWSIQTKAKLLCLAHAGIRCAIFRRTYPELERNHIRVLVPEVQKIASYNKQEKRLTFINGSVIEFVFAQRESELNKIQGNEWDVIFIDEATQWTETEIKMITACNRGANSFIKRCYFTANPGGIGHHYFKRIFIDRKYTEGENGDDYNFISARVTDNYALMESDPDYIKYLEALPPKLKKAWLDGDWNVLSGAFFDEFVVGDDESQLDRTWTHVIDPFNPPLSWNCVMGYDFGYRKPFSAAWYMIDHDGRMYRVLEWYGCNGEPNEGLRLTPEEQFKKIHEIETQHPYLKNRKIQRVADPAIWNAESGESVADVAAKHQVWFSKGDNQRISGWMQCHYRMQFDENGIPMFYVFNTCKDFIRTIPLMQFDEHKVEDLNSDLEDHIADEWRYVCMSRPITPTLKKDVKEYGSDPLNQRIKKPKLIYVGHNV